MKRIYLDYAATTPTAPDVERVMHPFFSRHFGNPGSIHSVGQSASAALDSAREAIAASIGADFREIIFTGSATEANNLALRGFFGELRRRGIPWERPRLITSEIEHESVLEACRELEGEGIEVIYLPVDIEGRVKLDALRSALNERTVLVSIMYANNEIGTVQPISEIGKIISDFRKQAVNSKGQMRGSPSFAPSFLPLFHTDAVQALQFLDCSVRDLGVDFMTFSAHKIYGPKGAGVLYAKAQTANSKQQGVKIPFLSPLLVGGGQEFGLRSGTQNIPAIAGFAKAIELILKDQQEESRRIRRLKTELWRGIKKVCKEAAINGISDPKSADCLPNILNVYFPQQNALDLLIKLDLAGVVVSAGSACSARFLKSSHVVRALGCEDARTKSNLRFSLGRPTTEREVAAALRIIAAILTEKGKAA